MNRSSKTQIAKFEFICNQIAKMRDRLPECRSPSYAKRKLKRQVKESELLE